MEGEARTDTQIRIERESISNGNPLFNRYIVRRKDRISGNWTPGSKKTIKQVYGIVKGSYCWDIDFGDKIKDDLVKYEEWRAQQRVTFEHEKRKQNRRVQGVEAKL